MRGKRSRRATFQPPLKRRAGEDEGSQTSLPSQSDSRDVGYGDRLCHTVLSYCEEEGMGEGGVREESEEMDTQPLSMFSGERRRSPETHEEEGSRDLDDLFLNLDDPFSGLTDTQSSRSSNLDDTLAKLDNPFTKLDDPLVKLDDPFSVSHEEEEEEEEEEADSIGDEQYKQTREVDNPPLNPGCGSEGEGDGEQLVPDSPPLSPSQEGVEPERPEDESQGLEEKEEEGQVPRREFRGAVSSCRQYNLHVIPQQFRKTPATTTTGKKRGGRERSRVNWASSVSVWDMREGVGPGGGGEMGVFEVPLSVGEVVERGRRDEGSLQDSRSCNLSLSRLDLSHSSRTREEQVIPTANSTTLSTVVLIEM